MRVILKEFEKWHNWDDLVNNFKSKSCVIMNEKIL